MVAPPPPSLPPSLLTMTFTDCFSPTPHPPPIAQFFSSPAHPPDGNDYPSSHNRSSLPDDYGNGHHWRRGSTGKKGEEQEPEDAKQAEEEEKEEDVFSIPPKPATIEILRRWRKATLALNATRRFRYTTPVDREAQKEEARRRFLTTAHAVRAANRFRKAAVDLEDKRPEDGPPPNGFGLSPRTLIRLIQNQDLELLQHLGGVHGVADLLRSDIEKGIKDDSEEIQRRKDSFGTNTYPRKAHKNFFVFLWEACQDTTLIILMLCAALSLGFGIKSDGLKEGWYDGASIAFAVFLVVSVTAFSDYRQSLQFITLNEEKKNIRLEVVRGGRRLKISIYDVVVGDVLPLKIGDQIPADGLFVHGHSLSVDESSMTGESEYVHIDEKRPFLLSGCKVADGFGTMVVTSVGLNTDWGQLMAAISDDIGEETPLQVRLNGVATFIGQIGLLVAFLVLVILIIFYFTGHTSGSSGKFSAGHTKASDVVNSVVNIFSIAVTIVVVAVPEGLPLAVTLTLAYSMKKMMVDKALVRRLSACETMGSATTICSDKTGTLTLNMMTVVKAWVAGAMREPPHDIKMLSTDSISLVLEGIAQNSSGSIFVPKQGGDPEVTGSPTEAALLSWGLRIGMDFDDVRRRSSVLQVETFNSEKKRAGVAVRVVDSGKVHIHWKGAAEIILNLCVYLLDADGSILPLTDAKRAELNNVIEGMAAASFRCIAFAYRELETEEVPSKGQLEAWKIPEIDLTLISIVGIKDPCRPGVRDAVGLCQAAGVRVRMVTGDNIVTAKAIASECGILQQGGYAIEGAVFRNYSIEERRREVPKVSVMARSSPTDKLLLVQTLKDLGNVVAVTGDGTNDAPALHEADIGLSMGIQGTEVAKESSDIIILDDNFASVVKVVRWGRSVYFNIQKFIQFQMTVNVAALAVNFVAAVTSGNVPLTAVQLLWVNLIMDTLGALALATEPPTDDLMQKPPVGRKDPIITNVMWRNILGQAFYQIAVLLTLQFRGTDILKLSGSDADAVNKTIIFNSFVLCQIFNEFNARKPEDFNIFEGILRNHLFLGIIGTTLVLQVLIVEFLKRFASTRRLDWQQWLICIGIGFVSWPFGLLLKLIPVPEKTIAITNFKLWRQRQKRRPSKSFHNDLQGSHVSSEFA